MTVQGLLIRTDSIGDSILFLEPLRILGEGLNKKFDVVCQKQVAELYENHPYVQTVLIVDKDKLVRDAQYQARFLEQLKNREYEFCLNPIYSRDQICDFLTSHVRAKQKLGIHGDNANLPESQILNNNRIYSNLLRIEDPRIPEVEKNTYLVNQLLSSDLETILPRFQPSLKSEEWATEFLRQNEIEANRLLVLYAGAQYDVRKYESYGDCLKRLSENYDFTVIALGAKSDYSINEKALSGIQKAFNLSGTTSINQCAALLQKAQCSFGAETGLAHLSCAVGTPNAILLGGGHVGRFMPYSSLTYASIMKIDCMYCDWKCVKDQVHCVKNMKYEDLYQSLEMAWLNRESENINVYWAEAPRGCEGKKAEVLPLINQRAFQKGFKTSPAQETMVFEFENYMDEQMLLAYIKQVAKKTPTKLYMNRNAQVNKKDFIGELIGIPNVEYHLKS